MRKGFPYRVCGVLIGTKNNNKYIIKDFYDCENLNKARAADRYELNPKDYMQGEKIAKDLGLSYCRYLSFSSSHPAIASRN